MLWVVVVLVVLVGIRRAGPGGVVVFQVPRTTQTTLAAGACLPDPFVPSLYQISLRGDFHCRSIQITLHLTSIHHLQDFHPLPTYTNIQYGVRHPRFILHNLLRPPTSSKAKSLGLNR